MALINPVHTLLVHFLFVVTVPLSIFAGITTTLAFSVLICRVVVVYLDIALSLVPHCFASCKRQGPPPSPSVRPDELQPVSPAVSSTYSNDASPTTPTPTTQQHTLYARRRRRPSSATSVVSAGSATPVGEMALGLAPSIGADRDFEGVGGRRAGTDGDDDTWAAINSRFEFPDLPYTRSHHRTPSDGALTPGDSGVLMMKGRALSPEPRGATSPTSPNSSRTRTPSTSRERHQHGQQRRLLPPGHVADGHQEALEPSHVNECRMTDVCLP